MRQRDPLSPEEARELDALDRALAGDPVDSDLRELEQLVHDVRATAPEMSPGFAARLEHEVAEGFPQPREQPAPRRRARRRWVLIPAAGVLAAALVALVVVLGRGGDDTAGPIARGPVAPADGSAQQSGGSSLESGVPRESKAPAPARAQPAPSSGAGSAAADQAGTPPRAPAASVATPSDGARKQERSALLVLRVPNAKVDSTADGVIRTVDRFGGIIASSSSATQGSHGEATFELRIPTGKLDDALAALSRLGHVSERQQNLVDITSSFESAQERLSDARAERRGLLRALGRATTQQQIESLKARLRLVRSQIARLDGDLAALRRRADLSSVSLTVRGSGAKVDDGSGGGGHWSPADAARDAVRVLEVIAGVALIALAIAAPLGLLVALVAIAVRVTRRRRREGALDAA